MRKVVLDTDILSEILKRKNPHVIANALLYAREHERFTFTSVTAHEMIFGLESKQDALKLRSMRTLFEMHEIVVPTLEDYLRAGEVRGVARRLGRQIALDDCLIGVTAHRLGLPICTGNTGHFEEMRQAGLDIEMQNWRHA